MCLKIKLKQTYGRWSVKADGPSALVFRWSWIMTRFFSSSSFICIMQTQCRAGGAMPNTQSRQSISNVVSRPVSPDAEQRSGSAVPPPLQPQAGTASSDSPVHQPAQQQQQQQQQQPSAQPQQSSRDVLGGGNPFLNRRSEDGGQPGSAAGNLARSFFSRSSSQAQDGPPGSGGGPDDGEDTMKNLRKTFAGIFGDM